jgi:hypothetical protein
METRASELGENRSLNSGALRCTHVPDRGWIYREVAAAYRAGGDVNILFRAQKRTLQNWVQNEVQNAPNMPTYNKAV